MTNQERATEIAIKVREILALAAGAKASPFGGAGPSQEFIDFTLPASVATPTEVDKLVAAIDKATASGEHATVNKIAKVALGLIGGIKDVLI